jgi:CDP-diacylglycerol---serine O-phosphatidyltransferase
MIISSYPFFLKRRMRTLYKQIPNLLTLGNLLCGCLGILSQHVLLSAFLILIGMVFDFLDGFLAKLLHAQSKFGKELDSFADMVTFGVLPAFMLYQMILIIPSEFDNTLKYTALMIPIFSAIRLAKFNIDDQQNHQFIGLPTPACAFLIAMIPLITYYTPIYLPYIPLQHPLFLAGVAVVLSALLVAPIKMFALKFQDFSFKNNALRYVFLIISLILLLIFQFLGGMLVLILYIVLSLIFQNKTKTP